ncbi:hypothetical protein Pint_03706 [Pistacia integerrima]|uniref:Uncharacterized protein n=1 Tax=Pistacia integerrima TaxID=434235 RepID=A0ACC0Z5M4_9ROSI|nr:hypothetical protein Pint_03706 [Pistacia integerrima]
MSAMGITHVRLQWSHSKHWERSSPAQRQLHPRFNRLSIESES